MAFAIFHTIIHFGRHFSPTDCVVYICDFHREQAWERWLSKSSNGRTHLKAKTLTALRRIARATTEEHFQEELHMLKETSKLWSQHVFRKWFEKVWLSQYKVSNTKR